MSVDRWIRDLSMEPHPEGGFYRETQRSSRCTTIVYLLPAGSFSAWHRVHEADEVWHFYAGDPLSLHLLDEGGLREVILGQGACFHGVAPAETWQAAEPCAGPQGYSLVGCTVAPPFTFERLEMGQPSLLERWPEHGPLITRLLRS
jgi:predicted cupin superfamily sugar epimerase